MSRNTPIIKLNQPPKGLSAEAPQNNHAYFIHKMSDQLVGGGLRGVAQPFRATAEYQGHYVRLFRNPPPTHLLEDRWVRIYRNDNSLGRSFRNSFLPQAYRGNVSENELRALSERSNMHTKNMARWWKAGTNVMLVGNAGALLYCLGDEMGCSTYEYVTFSSALLSRAFLKLGLDHKDRGAGLRTEFLKATTEGEKYRQGRASYQTFARGRTLFMAMNGVQMVGGLAKVGIELRHAYQDSRRETKTFNLSAFVSGTAGISLGASWLWLNGYYRSAAAQLVKNIETLDDALEIHRTHEIRIPRKILWPARVSGAIAPLYSLYLSGQQLHSGFADDRLEDVERREKVISGSLGAAASVSFLGFAYFVTPAAAPIGVACFAIGSGLIAVQTAYDEWDSIKSYVSQIKRDPQAELKKMGAQAANMAQITGTAGLNHFKQVRGIASHAIPGIPRTAGILSTLKTQAQSATAQVRSAAPRILGLGAFGSAVLASAKAGFAAAGSAVASSTALTVGAVAVAGSALGAGIHYLGAGKYIGTDWLGEKAADVGIAITDWLSG